MLIEDVYPCLYAGLESVDEIKRKGVELDWARPALETMRREANQIIDTPPRLDIGVTAWRHSFYAHDTGGPLLFDEENADLHADPETGMLHTGDEKRGAWRQLAHERLYRIMRSLALLYRCDGNEDCAAWAAVALTGSTIMYSHNELRNPRLSNALYNQPLYDAQILSLVAGTYRLLEPYLDEQCPETKVAIQEMFSAQLPVLLTELDTGAIHNTSAHIAMAVALIGEALGKRELIERGVSDPHTGLDAHFLRGLMSTDGVTDGFWFEGTLFYHLYTMFPLIELREISARNGIPYLQADDSLRSMFGAILKLTDHKGRLYCVGDFGAPRTTKLTLYRHLLEYGHGVLGCDFLGPILEAIYSEGPQRTNLGALAFGADVIRADAYRADALRGNSSATDTPKVAHAPLGPMRISPAGRTDWRKGLYVLERTGIARMASSGRYGTYTAWLKSGPYGGGHDHLDSLAFGLHVGDEIVSSDLGSPGYGLSNIRPFYKSTLSHNTILVDERPQNRVTHAALTQVDGKSLGVRGCSFDAYDGVRLEREIVLEPPLIHITDDCVSTEDHRYAWVFHAYGSLSTFVSRPCSPEHLQPLPEDDGLFSWFTGRDTAWTDQYFCADWRITEFLWLRLLITANTPIECTSGRTPGNPLTDTRGTVLIRCRRPTCRFRASLEMHTGWPERTSIDQ